MISRGDPLAKVLVARSFSLAAPAYDRVASLQREVGERLMEILPPQPPSACILDVGAGTGVLAAGLKNRHPRARIIALDIAEGMLAHSRCRFSGHLVAGDAESLPIRTDSVDLVLSNLAIQWCVSLDSAAAEFARVIRPGGHLVLTTFGERTLIELREAWRQVDGHSHVNDFTSAEELQQALISARFQGNRTWSEVRTVAYDSVNALMRELKALGAHNQTFHRPRHLMGKTAMARMVAAYATGHQDPDLPGPVQATYEVIYCLARCEV